MCSKQALRPIEAFQTTVDEDEQHPLPDALRMYSYVIVMEGGVPLPYASASAFASASASQHQVH